MNESAEKNHVAFTKEQAKTIVRGMFKDIGLANDILDALSSHKPRITAEDVEAEICTLLGNGTTRDLLGDVYDNRVDACRKMADRLNALLAHQSPDGRDGEWEEFTGKEGNERKYSKVECWRKYDDEWVELTQPQTSGEFSNPSGLYRRPKPPQSTPVEEQWEEFEPYTTHYYEGDEFFTGGKWIPVERNFATINDFKVRRRKVSPQGRHYGSPPAELLKRREEEREALQALQSSQPRGGQEMPAPETEAFGNQTSKGNWKADMEAWKKFTALLENQRDEARAQLAELAKKHDELMERSVGAMAIAEKDEGWEKVPIDCPMLNSVLILRKHCDALSDGRPTIEEVLAPERLKEVQTALDAYMEKHTNLQSQIATLHIQFEASQKEREGREQYFKQVEARNTELHERLNRQTQGGRLTGEIVATTLTEAKIFALIPYKDMSESGKTRWDGIAQVLNSHLISPWTAITGPETLPKESDGDRNGNVEWLYKTGQMSLLHWSFLNADESGQDSINPKTHWRHTNLPAPEPEQVEDWKVAYEEHRSKTTGFLTSENSFKEGWLDAQEKGKV